MKPVNKVDFSEGCLTKDSLLWLNVTVPSRLFVKQLLSCHNTNTCIRSKGGISLPNEVWAMIFKHVQKDLEDMEDMFVFVKAETVVASPSKMLLRCNEYDFLNENGKWRHIAGHLGNSQSVKNFEKYLVCATGAPAIEMEPYCEQPELRRISGPASTFDVVLGAASTDPCLYTFLDVPDFIANVEGGCCWVCDDKRFICPGCTGGRAQEFGSFMSCGVNLACPLCVGLEISKEHKDFLQSCLWGETPDEDEVTYIQETLEDRLEDLGYRTGVPDGAWSDNFNERF